jgi:hypothetical protein
MDFKNAKISKFQIFTEDFHPDAKFQIINF